MSRLSCRFGTSAGAGGSQSQVAHRHPHSASSVKYRRVSSKEHAEKHDACLAYKVLHLQGPLELGLCGRCAATLAQQVEHDCAAHLHEAGELSAGHSALSVRQAVAQAKWRDGLGPDLQHTLGMPNPAGADPCRA